MATVWESHQFLLSSTTLSSDLILMITDYLIPTGLLFVEHTIPTSTLTYITRTHLSTGVYFSRQEAVYHFGKLSSHRRIMSSFAKHPFHYRVFVARLAPGEVIQQDKMTCIINRTYADAQEFKDKLSYLRRRIMNLPFGREKCPFRKGERLLIDHTKQNGYLYWSYKAFRAPLSDEDSWQDVGWVL